MNPGLYESLITEALAARLGELPAGKLHQSDLRNAEAADRIAWHIASVVERAISSHLETVRAEIGVAVARRLIDLLTTDPEVAELADERPVDPGAVLRAIHRLRPDGTPEAIEEPLIPLLDSALLTNAPGEPRVLHQLSAEIDSADRIDLVMAFIRRSGLQPLREKIRRHVDRGLPFRVLTTTYTGSTEAAALDLLRELGAEIKVSYDTSTTRLHAKAWLFHRESGFSTAYVGSSNVTHSAQVTGLEWNIRISGARNRPIIEKIAAVFESYWSQADFEEYDPARFAAVTRHERAGPELILPPTEIRLEPLQERLLEEIELSREQGFHRNLLAAATGTGKR